MKRRITLLFAGAEAVSFLVAVWFEPTCIVRGSLRGEAFFDGKPTSWWRRELTRWETWEIKVHVDPLPPQPWIFISRLPPRFARHSTWSEKVQERWLGRRIEVDRFGGPSLLHDEEAGPVLRELQDDPSPEIRKLAQVGLDHCAETARFRIHGPAPEVLMLFAPLDKE
jgi:hypothetical protein